MQEGDGKVPGLSGTVEERVEAFFYGDGSERFYLHGYLLGVGFDPEEASKLCRRIVKEVKSWIKEGS